MTKGWPVCKTSRDWGQLENRAGCKSRTRAARRGKTHPEVFIPFSSGWKPRVHQQSIEVYAT